MTEKTVQLPYSGYFGNTLTKLTGTHAHVVKENHFELESMGKPSDGMTLPEKPFKSFVTDVLAQLRGQERPSLPRGYRRYDVLDWAELRGYVRPYVCNCDYYNGLGYSVEVWYVLTVEGEKFLDSIEAPLHW